MSYDKGKMGERRVHPRHQARIDVNYRHGDTYLFSRTENVSELGVFLVSEEPFAVGTRIELSFRLAEGGDPVEVIGEVMWVDSRGAGKTPGMGIRFTDLDAHARMRIKELIRTVAYLE